MSKLQLANLRKNTEKKSCCVSAIEIMPGDLEVGTPSFALGIPGRTFIKSLHIVEEADSDVGSLTIEYFDNAGDKQELIPAADAGDGDDDGFGVINPNVDLNLMAPEGGMDIWITAAAEMTKGKTIIIIEYTEYALSSGHLTSADPVKAYV